MNCFVPLSTHPPSARRARVRSAEASEPASGSVRQKAPIMDPAAMGLRKRSFCSGEPKRRMGAQPTELCTLMTVETAPLPAAISSSAVA